MSDGLVISFDASSIRRIAQMAGISGLLSAHINRALYDGANLLIETSRLNMNWENPTGELEDSMDILSDKPYEIIMGSQLPYARRREEGFHGADSLGRIYNDIGAFFLSDAVDEDEDQIMELIYEAIDNTFAILNT